MSSLTPIAPTTIARLVAAGLMVAGLALNAGVSHAAITFTDIGAGLPRVNIGSASWGDYDKDGDLDILLTGNGASGIISRLCRNDGGGVFTERDVGLTGVSNSSVVWGDYDNDGDLDILLAGYPGPGGAVSRIYRNDGGEVFTDISAALGPVNYASAAWGDYDNDGDLDILLTGLTGGSVRISRLYRNDGGGAFAEINPGLPGVSSGSVAWGDYDNDGDLDILLTGYTGSARLSRVYRNDGEGVFTDIAAGLEGINHGSVVWGDYDDDGDLDILLAGMAAGAVRISGVYRNDGSGIFTDIAAGLEGVENGSVAWGDYDNDGDLDVLLTGQTGTGEISRVYRNDGGGVFTDIIAGLEGVSYSSVAWGDYDNDGDLDILLTGFTATAFTSIVYRSDGAPANTPPAPPIGLSAERAGDWVTLSWNASTDAQTPSGGLSYNLRIGTTRGGNEVCSGMAHAASGYRRVVRLGNAQQRTSWTLRMPPGRYFWSVQALDGAYAGSEFATEQGFDVQSRVWHVPAEVPTIQAGIDSAVTADTVLVADGTYTGPGNRNLDFGGKGLVLRSENGRESTIIDCQHAHRGMHFHSGESPAAVVDGFTIKRGKEPLDGGPGGIWIDSSSPTIRNCAITGCQGGFGGGVYIGYGSGSLVNCVIISNEAVWAGGIGVEWGSPTIADCEIMLNRVGVEGGAGAGIFCCCHRDSTAPVIMNCMIAGNRAGSESIANCDGGGLYVALASPTLVNCTISGNSASGRGGGIASVADGSVVTLEKSILWGNFATTAGGEAWIYGVHDTIAFYCSAVDTSRIESVAGIKTYLNGNIFTNPLFCLPACSCPPETGFDFRLSSNSPCLAASSPCGELVGARGQGCGPAVAWVGAGNGTSWGDGANWSTGMVPQPGEHVQITRGVGDHVRLTAAAAVAELTLCGHGSATDTLEIAAGGQLEVPKVRSTEEILVTEGETLGGDGSPFFSPGQLVVQPDTLRNLPGGEVALEAGSISGSGTFFNYEGARFAKLGIGVGEVGLDFQNGGLGGTGDTAKVDVLGGTLTVSDSLDNEGALTVGTGGALEVQDRVSNLGSGVFRLWELLTGSGVVENYGLFEKTGPDTGQVAVFFRNLRDEGESWVGEVRVLEGALAVQGLLENRANLTVEPGAVLDIRDRVNNLATGVFELKGTSSGSGTIENRGLIRKTGQGTSSVTADLDNILDTGGGGGGGARGRVEVANSRLTVATLDNNGIVSIAAGATLAVSGSILNRVNATVEGLGTLDVSASGFTNHGILSPGPPPGTLQVTGGFVQSPTGEITINVAGTAPGQQYDEVSVNGPVSLGGALHVVYSDGFSPSEGDTFEVIQWQERPSGRGEGQSGDGFSCFSGLEPPGGLLMRVVELPDAFLLVAVDSVSGNQPPAAQPDYGTTDPFTPLVLWLVGNDTDPDAGDVLSIVSVSTVGLAGSVFVNAGDTTVTYVPPIVFAGLNTFWYYVTDCEGGVDSALVTITVTGVTRVEELERGLPDRCVLHPGYPNPFNPLTTIQFELPEAGPLDLAIYDVQGRRVRTLATGYHQAGRFTATWPGTDDDGRDLAAGIYFVRMQARDYVASGKLVLAK